MRIVAKNLPQTATKNEIESHFSQMGPVTDVFMLVNGKGAFRRVCFIGYATEEAAAQAATHFNETYFKNQKITVELAKDDEKAPPSETRLRRALYTKAIVVRNGGDEEAVLESLRKYGEITSIETKQCSSVVKFKKGEDAERVLKEVKTIAGKRVKIGCYVEKAEENRKEHFNTLFFNFEAVMKRTCEVEGIERSALLDLKDKGLGAKISLLETGLVSQTKRFLEDHGIFLDRITGRSDRLVILRNSDLLGALDLVKGDFTVGIAPSKCLALLRFKDPLVAAKCCRDLNMKRHKNEVIYCEMAPTSPPNPAPPSTEKSVNKIVVKNVPFQATADELKKIFSAFAGVVDVRIPVKTDGTPRGFAFVILDAPKSVDEAIEYFGSSTHLYGRRLVLERAKS